MKSWAKNPILGMKALFEQMGGKHWLAKIN